MSARRPREAPPPAPAERGVEPDGGARLAFAAAFVLLFALRLLFLFHREFDSDEPQHLHVVWGWTQGMLPYRDFFDNHAPLFHLACAPLLALAGERAESLFWMRLAMFPVFAATIACVYALGHALFSARAGRWGALLAALWPEHFLTSLEFRPDGAWSALWLLALLLLARGRLTARRAAVAGLVLGIALAVSIKTVLLLAALAAAAPAALAATRPRGLEPGAPRALATRAAAFAAGLVVAPAVMVAGFAIRGALGPLFECTVRHNLLPGGSGVHGGRLLLFPLALVPLGMIGRALAVGAPDAHLAARRVIVFLAAGLGFAALESFWPLLTPQDFLPFEPLAALFVAAWLIDHRLGFGAAWRRRALVLAAVAETLVLMFGRHPLRDDTRPQIDLVRDALRLTRRGEPILDLKGETVFRPRPFYWVLETLARERLRLGLIPDRIPERLVETRTAVVAGDNRFFPPRARAFMSANYVSVGRLRVLGHVLGEERPGAAAAWRFTIAIPARYDLVAERARTAAAPGSAAAWAPRRASGSLDGRPWRGPRELAAGAHEYRPAAGEARVVLVWARALENGYPPRPVERPLP